MGGKRSAGGGGWGFTEQEIEEGTDMQLDSRTEKRAWLKVYRTVNRR